MIGILARFPDSIAAEFDSKMNRGGGGLLIFLIETAVLIAVIMGLIVLVQGVRKIAINYAKQIVGNRQLGGARQFLPLKVNSSGVMPIIFAQAIMFVPLYFRSTETFPDSEILASLTNIQGWGYNILLFCSIILFTFFYTAIVTNPQQIADDLKRNGNFVPGVKPGKPTAEFIDNVLSRITLPGGMFVGAIAILPALVMMVGLIKTQQFSIFFGGTSLLITV